MKLTKTDLVASSFRNAIFDASTLNIFEAEERPYEKFDATVLERCYQTLDKMSEETINLYAQAISYGFEINYDRDAEEFIVIVQE
jgi:hypothetical protein